MVAGTSTGISLGEYIKYTKNQLTKESMITVTGSRVTGNAQMNIVGNCQEMHFPEADPVDSTDLLRFHSVGDRY